jgi:hypothetical protein
MADPIVVGNTLRTNLTVKDDNDVLTDPTTLTLTVVSPSGVSTTYTHPSVPIIRLSEGLFYAEFVLTEIGLWEYIWRTTVPVRDSGGEAYVISGPTSSAPYAPTVVDFTRLYLGGENWAVLFNSENFGIDTMLLAVEIVKRRVLTTPTSPSGESALNIHMLAYLGILTALELLPACKDAWASRLISRSTGNEPSEITTYTNREQAIDRLQDMLLRRVAGLYKAALPYLDPTINVPVSVAGIDEDDDLKVTENPRLFPPAWAFPYQRDEVIRW